MDRDFSIGEKKFKLSKINAIKQFHIVRRISPLLSELVPAMSEISRVGKSSDSISEEQKLEQFAKVVSPIMMGLSKLSDRDSDYVLFGLLASVEMQQESGNWARIASDDHLMFSNLELPVLLQAAGRAFAFNMSGFFSALHQTS